LAWKPTSILPRRSGHAGGQDSVQTTEKSAKLEISILTNMSTAKLKTIRSLLTADCLLVVVLFVEGFLCFSERLRWFSFNERKGWTVLIATAVVGATLALVCACFLVCLCLRWRFQFRIRSLLILTLVIAVVSDWLAVQMREASRQRQAVTEIRSFDGVVRYRGLQTPDWLRFLFGDDFFYEPTDVGWCDVADMGDSLRSLRELKHIHELNLIGTNATDSDLANLEPLKELRRLRLRGPLVTDTGVRHLRELNQLTVLDLSGTQITDLALVDLKGLTQLRQLDVRNTQLSDAALPTLASMVQLERLDLSNTRVSNKTVVSLQRVLPGCTIYPQEKR
jgi:Leucine-rich repeat (LRR) protein